MDVDDRLELIGSVALQAPPGTTGAGRSAQLRLRMRSACDLVRGASEIALGGPTGDEPAGAEAEARAELVEDLSWWLRHHPPSDDPPVPPGGVVVVEGGDGVVLRAESRGSDVELDSGRVQWAAWALVAALAVVEPAFRDRAGTALGRAARRSSPTDGDPTEAAIDRAVLDALAVFAELAPPT